MAEENDIDAEEEEEEPEQQKGCCQRFCYNIVLFFAYWFGSSRFDHHGNGGFDIDNVKAYLADQGFISKTKHTMWKGKGLGAKSKSGLLEPTKSTVSAAKLGKSGLLEPTKSTVSAAKLGQEVLSGPLGGPPTIIDAQPIATEDDEEEPIATEDDEEDVATPRWEEDDGIVLTVTNAPSKMFREKIVMDSPTLGATSTVRSTKSQKGAAEDIDYTYRRFPWFLVVYSALVGFIWLIGALASMGKRSDILFWQIMAGLDTFAEGSTNLRVATPDCQDVRSEVWRIWTYQFTHVGAMHVLVNGLLNIVLGMPFEGRFGWWRIMICYNIGVIGAALLYMACDAHTPVVGCSGGSYIFVGMHIMDIILNFRAKRFKIATLLLVLILVGLDYGTYFVMSLDQEQTSLWPHIGGAIFGLVLGGIAISAEKVGHTKKNSTTPRPEDASVGSQESIIQARTLKRARIARWGCLSLCSAIGFGVIGFCAWFIATQQEQGAINFWENGAGTEPWCWMGQIWNVSVDEYNWLCVRCNSKSCMDEWASTQDFLEPVSTIYCRAQGFYSDER